MNLTKLFEPQRKLDERVVMEKGLEGQDLWSMKILALQVELGELANEWRGFKFWSNRQTPTVKTEMCDYCEEEVDYTRPSPFMGDIGASMCKSCWDSTKEEYTNSHDEHIGNFEDYPHFKKKEPVKLLEEYVDCLHFILSIGNCLRNIEYLTIEPIKHQDITSQFNELFGSVYAALPSGDIYGELVNEFIGLGEMLGFTWEQIEQSYYTKNQINHERQSTGY